MKTYKGETIVVESYKRGGYFILRITENRVWLVATKGSRKPHREEGWTTPIEKKFERMETANRYFTKIKESHPTMVLVSSEPNKYRSYDGKVKEY